MLLVSAACCLMGVLAPMSSHTPVALDRALSAVALALAAACWLCGREPRPWIVHGGLAVSIAGATTIIAVASTPAGEASIAVSYVWMVVYAAFFASRRATRGYVIAVGAGFAAALTANPIPGAAQVWLMVMLTTAVAGESVATMTGRLDRLATTDPLTGLLNRGGLAAAGDAALADLRRTAAPLTAVVIDLDDFKAVNDTRGHAAGDRLLVELARAWRPCLRDGDVLARPGGDEFVLLLPGVTKEQAAPRLARLRAASTVAWSVGTATACPGEDLQRLLDRADRALYVSKQQRSATALRAASVLPRHVRAEQTLG